MSRDPRQRNSQNKLWQKITLYVVGISLIVVALLIVLKQFGLFSSVPGYVYIVIPLIILGVGIISGLNKS